MLLVMQAPAELLVCSVALVHCRWNPLILVLGLLVPHLMIQVLARCLMGDSLCRIRGYRVIQFQGMAFLF
jgi:cytochrome c oxidase subunit IV